MLAGVQQKLPLNLFNEKLYLVRVNNQGDTLWTRTHKVSNFDAVTVQGVCENAAGQVLVLAGGGNTATSVGNEAILLLLNVQGDTIWTRKVAGPLNNYYDSVVLGNDGNFVLTATLNTYPQWLKINAAGQIVAQTNINYDSSEIGYVTAVIKDNTGLGGYWLLNVKAGTNPGRKMLHLTEAGIVDQTKYLAGEGPFRSINPFPQGGYLAANATNGKLIRFSSTLDTVWTKQLRYTHPNGLISGYASAYQVQPLADGNLVVAGSFYYQSGNRVYLSKISPAGQVLRDTVLFRLGGDEWLRGLAVEPGTSNYVFSGYATQGPRGGSDLLLGIHANWRTLTTRSAARSQPALTLEAWPNPLGAHHELHLRAAQPLSGLLVLHDALGRIVRTWPATRSAAQAEGQVLSLAGVPPGVYLLIGTAPDGRRLLARLVRE